MGTDHVEGIGDQCEGMDLIACWESTSILWPIDVCNGTLGQRTDYQFYQEEGDVNGQECPELE